MMAMKMKVMPQSLPLRNVQSSEERSHDHLSCGCPRQKGSCIWAVFGSWLSEGKKYRYEVGFKNRVFFCKVIVGYKNEN